MVSRGDGPDDGESVLVADKAPPYSKRFEPAWTSSGDAVVPVAKTARLFVKNARVDGVRVTFKPS